MTRESARELGDVTLAFLSGEILFERYPANLTSEPQLRVDRKHRSIIRRIPRLHSHVPFPSLINDDSDST